MMPSTIDLILFFVEEACKEEPVVQQALIDLFTSGAPTDADWAAKRAEVSKSYRQLVPNTQLPPSEAP